MGKNVRALVWSGREPHHEPEEGRPAGECGREKSGKRAGNLGRITFPLEAKWTKIWAEMMREERR
eukprot:2920747-Rhodomonas_salina.2